MKILSFILLILFVNKIECDCLGNSCGKATNCSNIPRILIVLREEVKRYRAQVVIVYEDGVARIPCLLKEDGQEKPAWSYTNEIQEKYTPLTSNDRTVIYPHNVTIFHVTASDAGIYRCRHDNLSSIVILEVVSYKDHPVLSETNEKLKDESKLVVYSRWSPWSECSVCGVVGKKRRFGMCYVKNRDGHRCNDTAKQVLDLFNGGLPCHSKYLPDEIGRVPAVKTSQNIIDISECKEACKHIIFEVSSNKTVVERANNSAGVYSLLQELPADVPLPVRTVLFAARDQRLVVRCPGQVNRDVPLRWRVGERWLDKNGRRIYVDERDDLVIETVTDTDAVILSCWAHGTAVGSVRLVLEVGTRAGRGLALLGAVLVAAVAHKLARGSLRTMHLTGK